MRLTEMVSEVGLELNRSDIDARIKRWIQQSIDYVFDFLSTKGVEASTSLTAAESTETMALPTDYGELKELRYTPGDGSGFQLHSLNPSEFFRRNADQTNTGYPSEFCIHAGQLHLAPLPSDTHSYTITYKFASVNVFNHTLNFTDADGAAATGVLVYLDEDAVETGVGRLYFVSPTETDGIIRLASADGHVHDVTIYHSASAATLGVAWYFDEDGGTTADRNFFISPTRADCVVQTDVYRKHSHYIKFLDASNAAALGVGVYLDENAASKAARLLFVSPTDTDGTSETVLSKDDVLPPFVERYHEAVYLLSVSKGLRYEKMYAESGSLAKEANGVLGVITAAERRRKPASVVAKPFSARRRDAWDALRWPEIDD